MWVNCGVPYTDTATKLTSQFYWKHKHSRTQNVQPKQNNKINSQWKHVHDLMTMTSSNSIKINQIKRQQKVSMHHGINENKKKWIHIFTMKWLAWCSESTNLWKGCDYMPYNAVTNMCIQCMMVTASVCNWLIRPVMKN